MDNTEQIMTTEHPEWNRFADLLYGPEGCNFRHRQDGEGEWTCEGDQVRPDKPIARKLLAKYFPEIDVETTLKYFNEHGGGCDCEIILNVDGHAREEAKRQRRDRVSQFLMNEGAKAWLVCTFREDGHGFVAMHGNPAETACELSCAIKDEFNDDLKVILAAALESGAGCEVIFP